MRARCAFALLAWLIASFDAQAQDTSAGLKCAAVPDTQHWTKQEIFVWDRVTAGAVANFNVGTTYGGNLDPKGKEGLPDSRVLTPKFLETILLNDKYRCALTRYGVRIIGGRFKEKIDLVNADVEHELWIDKSVLEKGADFTRMKTRNLLSFQGTKVVGSLDMFEIGIERTLYLDVGGEFAAVNLGSAHIGGAIDFTGSKVTGRLNLDNIQVDGSVYLRDKAEFAAVSLGSAHIRGMLVMSGAKVTGELYMDKLQVDSSVFMRDKGQFAAINLGSAHVGGTLDFSSSKVTGTLNMDKARVDSSVFMRDKAEFAEVILRSAHIAGTLELSSAKVTGTLNMDKLRVDSSLFMRDGGQFATVILGSAHVGGTLEFTDSKVNGVLNMDKLRVESSLFMGGRSQFTEINLNSAFVRGSIELIGAKATKYLDMTGLQIEGALRMDGKAEFAAVDLESARIGRLFTLRGSKVNGPLNCDTLAVEKHAYLSDAEFLGEVKCTSAAFKENVDLTGSTFHDVVDFSGARIGGELEIGYEGKNPVQWKKDLALILRNARIETIPSLSDAWPNHIIIEGLSYRSLREITPSSMHVYNRSAGDPVANWLAKQDQYSPQVYEQLAIFYQGQGHAEVATAIRYANKVRERNESNGMRYAGMTVLDWVIGFGHHIERAIVWIVGLVLMGALVLRLSGQGLKNGLPFGLSYSFDMLLPVIKLREAHYDVDLAGWPRYYFYCHKIMGYILASFLIVGISGLTK